MNVFVWRADARKADWKDTRVAGLETGPKAPCHKGDEPAACDWTAESFEELKRLIGEQVPEGEYRRAAMKTIEQRLDPTKAMEGEDKRAEAWSAQARSRPAPEVYEKSLAGQWLKTGCAADGSPYVLRGLIGRLDALILSPFKWDSLERLKLAAAFLDKDCAGARGLSEDEIAKLKKIAAEAPPPAPKP